MRTIKFRAWHKQEKKMYEVTSIRFGVRHGMAPSDLVNYVELDGKSRVYIHQCCSVDDEVELMQFTGLLGKNGEGIYEGDIVQSSYLTPEDGVLGLVSFLDGCFIWQGNDERVELARLSRSHIEVVSNVYESTVE